MKDVDFVQNIMIQKTAGWSDLQKDQISFGGARNYLKYKRSPSGFSDPLCIELHSDEALRSISFNLDENCKTQYIKPVGVTPFYISYLTSPAYDIKLLDFYSWTPHLIFYRVFYYNYFSGIPQSDINARGTEYFNISLHNKSVNFYTTGFRAERENQNLIFIQQKQMYSVRTVIFSEYEIQESILHPENVFKEFKRLTTTCEQKNISYFFSTQLTDDEQKLSALWRTQRTIRPDFSIDPELLMDCDQHATELTWIGMVIHYLDLESAKMQLTKALENHRKDPRLIFLNSYMSSFGKNELKNVIHDSTDNIFTKLLRILHGQEDLSETDFDDFPYYAYFTNSLTEDRICSYLQKWWNVNSLPVYAARFYAEFKADPERFFLIALLSLKYGLPWADHFIRRCCEFEDHPLLRLLINLNRLVIKIPSPHLHFEFASGPEWSGNRKSLKAKDFYVTYSAFGKRRYVTLHTSTEEMLKLDHACLLSIDKDISEYWIHPMSCFSQNVDPPMFSFRVGVKKISGPLLWRKAELNFYGIRVRWIRKKDRIQFTLQKRSLVDKCELNGEPIFFGTQNRIVRYYQLASKKPCLLLHCLDSEGRDIHYKGRSANRDVWLFGSILNRFGMLTDHFNCINSAGQSVMHADSEGIFNLKVMLPRNITELMIRIKGYSETLRFISSKGYANEAVLRYNSVNRQGEFIVVSDDILANRVTEIRTFFQGHFNFEPLYLLKSGLHENMTFRVLIIINNGDQKFIERRDSSLSNRPYLECGIEFLLNISTQQQLLSVLLDS